jgi:hypothetical protein
VREASRQCARKRKEEVQAYNFALSLKKKKVEKKT